MDVATEERDELRKSASACVTDALWATDNRRYINKPIFHE